MNPECTVDIHDDDDIDHKDGDDCWCQLVERRIQGVVVIQILLGAKVSEDWHGEHQGAVEKQAKEC